MKTIALAAPAPAAVFPAAATPACPTLPRDASLPLTRVDDSGVGRLVLGRPFTGIA